MNGEALVADFVAHITWDVLPEPVRHKAWMCLVDNLGATLAGTLTRVSQIATEWAAQRPAGPDGAATILLHGQHVPAAAAAFANGCAANGIDIDDSARYAYGHAGAQIFPTALAVAETLALNGAQMLTAMVVGYEVAHRVGRCWHDHHNVYQACGSWGSVACAAVAAHLMGLSPAQAQHALGIAEYHAPNLPMMRDVDHPAMVKHGIGWGAMTGVIAAELAAGGFTGIPSILGFEEYRPWVEDIGQEYLMVEGVAWKSQGYACCGWAHAATEGARRLVQEHDIDLDDIVQIQVEAFHETARLGTRLPATTEEAQFNVAWPLAAMLVDEQVGPAQMLGRRLDDPHIRALAQKVHVVESEELNALCRLFEQGDPRGRFASIVTIKLQDGREYNSGMVDGGLRFPQPGWDESVMEKKFRWLAEYVLEPARVDAVVDLLQDWERVSNVGQLTEMLGASA